MESNQTFSNHYFKGSDSLIRKIKSIQEKQADSLKMYLDVERHCDKHEQIIALYPDFQIPLSIFKAKIAAITDLFKLKELLKKRMLTKNLDSKTKLCRAGADIAGLLLVNLKTTNTISLKPEVLLFYNELIKMKDDALVVKIQHIYDSGLSHLDVLTHHGVTLSLLDAFQKMIADYFKPTDVREASEEEAEICRNLRALFRETDSFLKENLDKNVSQFRKKNPQFVYAYKENRIIANQ